MADVLEDDFVIDRDLVALSDEGEDDIRSVKSVDTDLQNNQSERKRKRKAQDKERKIKVLLDSLFFRSQLTDYQRQKRVEDITPVHALITNQSPGELSTYLSSLQATTLSELSSLELEDVRIPEYSVADTRAWTGARTLDVLVEFIEKVSPTLRTRLGQRPKNSGSPTLFFLAGAALRVADVTRILKDKKLKGSKGGEVAKLFGKHFKLAQHIAYLKKMKVGVAVGTPGRIGKLLQETDGLSISALTHIIFDATHRDAKNRNLFDIPETREDIFRSVLGVPEIMKGIKEKRIQIILF
ncbi:U3-containing 90S pre-ribosomal complex subunit domain containing protein [Amanita muscaria]